MGVQNIFKEIFPLSLKYFQNGSYKGTKENNED